MPVAKHMADFLNDPKLFMEYERPPQVIDMDKDTDGAIKREMIKTYALASIIYEDDMAEQYKLPFIHHSVDDLGMLKAEELALKEDVDLISTFKEFSNIQESLEAEDMVPPDVLEKHLAEQDDPEQIRDFIMSEQGGGGMAKCYPLSYL